MVFSKKKSENVNFEKKSRRQNSPICKEIRESTFSVFRKQEVIQLEQKAQEANTEDERLSVELQAVEMQISMVSW